MAGNLPALQGEIEFDASRATEELRRLERELERLSSGDLAAYLTLIEQLTNAVAASSSKMGGTLKEAVQAPAQAVAPAVDGLKKVEDALDKVEQKAKQTTQAVQTATRADPTDFGYGGVHPSNPKHPSNLSKPQPSFSGVVVDSVGAADLEDLQFMYENFQKNGRALYEKIAKDQAEAFAKAQVDAGNLAPDRMADFIEVSQKAVAESLFSTREAQLVRDIATAGGRPDEFIGPIQDTMTVVQSSLGESLSAFLSKSAEVFKTSRFFPEEGPDFRAGMPGFEQITQYIQQNAGASGRLLMEQLVKKYDQAVKEGIPFSEEMFRRITSGFEVSGEKNLPLSGALQRLEEIGVSFPEGAFPVPTTGATLAQTVGSQEELARIIENIKDKHLDIYRNSERWQKGQATVADIMTHLASSSNRRDQFILSDLQKKLRKGYSEGFEGQALAGRVFDEPTMKSLQEHFAGQGFKGQLPLLDMGKSADATFDGMVKSLTQVNQGLDQMHAKSERVSRSSLYDERRRNILFRTLASSANMIAPGIMPRPVQMGMNVLEQTAYADPSKFAGLMKIIPILGAVGAAAGVTGLAIREMWQHMNESETQEFNLQRLNRVFGDTKKVVDDIGEALGGQLSGKQITAAIGGVQRNSQLANDAEALEQLSLVVREFSQKAGIPFEQAMQQIVGAIQSGNVDVLEQMGLMKDARQALRDYADAHGTAIGQLKPWEVEMVLVNKAITDNQQLLSEQNTAVENTTEAWDRVTVSAGEAKKAFLDAFGDEFVAALDTATTMLIGIGTLLDKMAENRKNRMEPLGSDDKTWWDTLETIEEKNIYDRGGAPFNPTHQYERPTAPPGGWGNNAAIDTPGTWAYNRAHGLPDRQAPGSGEPTVWDSGAPQPGTELRPASNAQAQADLAQMITLVGEYNTKLDELKAKLAELQALTITGSEQFAANEKAKEGIESQIAGFEAMKDSAYSVFTLLAEGIEGTGESAADLGIEATEAGGALTDLGSSAGIAGSAMAAAQAQAEAFAATLDSLENSAISAGYALAGRLVNKLGVTGAVGYGNQFRGEADQLRAGIENINNQRIAAGAEQIPEHIATWAFQELRENQEFVVDGFTKMGDTGVGQAERVKKAWDSAIEGMISGTRKDTTDGLLPIVEDPNDKNAVDSLAASAYGDVKKLGLDPTEVALSTSAIMKEAGLGRQDEVDEPARRMLDVVKLGTKSPNYDLVKHLIPPEVQEQGEQAIREFAARMVKGHRDGISNALYDTGAAVDNVIKQIQGKIAQQDFVKEVQAELQKRRDAGEALPGMSDEDILKAMGVDTTPERMAKAMENQGMTLEQILKGISELPADLMEIDPNTPNPLVAATQIEAEDETALKGSGTTAGTVAGDAFVAQVETGNYGGAAVQKILDGIAAKEQELKDSGADAAAWWGSAFTTYIEENTPAELYKIMVPDLVPLIEAALKNNSGRNSGE